MVEHYHSYDFQSEYCETIDFFQEMNLPIALLLGISSYGFFTPSPLQKKAIPAILKKQDFLVQSPLGTGKTVSLAIGVLGIVDISKNYSQAIILSPAKEFAIQIKQIITDLAEYSKITVHCLILGENIKEDKEKLKTGVQIIISTPKRLINLINKDLIQADSLKIIAIDDADKMIAQGFFEQIQEIIELLSLEIQLVAFSSTENMQLRKFEQKYIKGQNNIFIPNQNLTLEGVQHFYVYVEKEEWKYETLIEILEIVNTVQCMIFCNGKAKLAQLTDYMNEQKFKVFSYSQEYGKDALDSMRKEFMAGNLKILITERVLPLALGILPCTFVINFDLAEENENDEYVKRLGKSGKFGRKVLAINLVNNDEMTKLKELEKKYNIQINELPEKFINLL